MDKLHNIVGSFVYVGVFFVRVDEVIRRLKQERPDEEVFIVVNNDRGKYYKIQNTPAFYHAGPYTFENVACIEETKSVVLIPIVVDELK